MHETQAPPGNLGSTTVAFAIALNLEGSYQPAPTRPAGVVRPAHEANARTNSRGGETVTASRIDIGDVELSSCGSTRRAHSDGMVEQIVEEAMS
jgi:hypothetical protein